MMARAKAIAYSAALCFLAAALFPRSANGQSSVATEGNAPLANRSGTASVSPSIEFASKAESLIGVSPVNRGEWGLLVVDSVTGETLYERNADSYFVPASNMKLLTTALALDKLGPDFRFRTTLETNGTLSSSGLLTGDL